MDITIEEDLGAPFIKTLDDHRWDRDYNEVLNFNPTSRPAQRLVWASLRASLTREAALRARIGDVAGMAFVIAEDYCPVGMPTIVSPVDINVARAVSAWLKEGK